MTDAVLQGGSPGRGTDVPDVLGFLGRLAGNIAAGTRLALFRRFSGEEFATGAWYVIALAAIDLALAVGYDYLAVEPERYFSMYGFLHFGAIFLVFVLGLFVVASIQSDSGGTQRLLVVVLSTVPLMTLAWGAVDYLYFRSGHYTMLGGWIVWGAWAVWGYAILCRVLRERYAIRKGRMIGVIILYALIVEPPQLFVQDLPFWYSYGPEDYSPAEEEITVNTERVYYAQPALLERAARGLLPERPGITDLYFVGFGSYAAQDVFMKEVGYVRDLFDRTYDTRGRSVALINNVRTVDYFPVATASNLRIVLGDVAERMDTSEDVLFLFLTSHGSKNAVLSIEFSALAPNDLSDEDLYGILAETGIRWRILVVSACYSGSFIERLKDPYTLIMTAAHEDNTSFGCSNDRNLTYFGEHYFSRELVAGGSFVDAFHRARETLHAREIEEGIDPSDPQIFIGAEMEEKLAELEARFPLDAKRLADASSGQCDEHPALPGERLPAVHGEPVVEHENVACAPGKERLGAAVR